MKIAIACDHRGYEAKRRLLPVLKSKGHVVEDFGCDNLTPCDYPDFALPAAMSIAEGKNEIGILMDGTGIGMCVAANKVKGIRAALVHDEVTARFSREKNHCNILCLGTDLLSEDQIRNITDIFIDSKWTDGRHTERVRKVMEIEKL